MSGLTRRRLLTLAGAVTATAAGASTIHPTRAEAAPSHTPPSHTPPGHINWTPQTTANRWPVVDHTRIGTFPIEGSDADVALLTGASPTSDVATMLLHIARRFSYEITALTANDIHGYTTNRTITAGFESNHLSGTAILIKPDAYPPGTTANLFPRDITIIRKILDECEGVIRWNGDNTTHPSEGHFHIDVPPGDQRLTHAATKIRSWRNLPEIGR